MWKDFNFYIRFEEMRESIFIINVWLIFFLLFIGCKASFLFIFIEVRIGGKGRF